MNVGLLFAFGAALTWGLVYALDQRLLDQLSPTVLLFTNALLTLIVAFPFLLFNDAANLNQLLSNKSPWPTFFLAGLLEVVASLCILVAIKHLNATTASLIEIAYPFFVAIFTLLLYRTMPNTGVLIGGYLY